jgi:perosamine synthetase
MGHLTVFSLHPVKLMTTGEGGVVTTDDEALAGRLRLFRNHGLSTDHRQREAAGSWFYEMVDLGYNYRITDFQCALGRSQLRKLRPWIDARRRIARAYDDAFASMPEIELPARVADRESAWHLYVIRLNLDRLRAGRLEVFNALRAERIGVNVHYIPVPWHPYYANRGYGRGCWPVAEAAYERILSLPIFPAMTDADTQDVIAAVQKVIAFFRK